MSAPFRRPNASGKSSYLDEFDEFKYENKNGGSGARTLKPPPEIWELVHPVPSQQFKPSQALVGRMATTKVMLMAVAVVAALGGGVAAWKLQVPQKVAAIFRESDAPIKKSAPATATIRRTPVETTKSEPNSVGSAATESSAVQSVPSANVDVVPTTTAAVTRRVVKKPPKPSVNVTDVAAPNLNGGVANTPSAVVTAKPKEQRSTTEQNATGAKVGNTASEASTAKPKAVATSSPQATAAPAKANPTPKPKVIQWP